MRALACLLAFAGLGRAAEPAPSLMAQGEEKLRQAGRELDVQKRDRLRAQVMELAHKLEAQDARDPDAHLLAARALSLADPAQPETCPPGACEKAADELAAARQLDVHGVDAGKIASELGIVLSRLHRYDQALDEYERALRRVDPERALLPGVWDDTGGRAVLYGNSAETLMALGRLDQAIIRYRQSAEASDPETLEGELASWGLGVALDRDEQEGASRQAIAHALGNDPTMSQLSGEGVFFEPPGDTHYYRALGHEVAGDRTEAIAAWKRYLAGGNPRWEKRAREHLARLEREKAPPEPPLHIVFGEPESFIGLRTVAELQKSLQEHESDLYLCYRRATRSQPKLSGELSLALDLSPTGHVWPPRVFQTRLEPEIAETSPVAGELRRCVELTAKNWRFSSLDRGPSSSLPPTENVMVRIELKR